MARIISVHRESRIARNEMACRRIVLSIGLTAALLALSSAGLARASAYAVDVTGTWNFSVDLGAGGKGTPVFSLKQKGQQITGTYDGPLGKHNVTGHLSGAEITITLSVTRDDGPLTLTYTGKVDNADSMGGVVTVARGDNGMRGSWRASKQK